MTGAYLFADAARYVALVPMKPSQVGILWHALAILDNEQWTQMRQQDLAKIFQIDRGTVSRAVADLCDRGILAWRAGQQYRLTPFLVWKGSMDAYRALPARRKAEAELAAGWHESRAVMAMDCEEAIEGMAFDPSAREAAMCTFLQCERPAEVAEPLEIADKPAGIGWQDWEAICSRLYGWGAEGQQRVGMLAAKRPADEDIEDWLDDYVAGYYLTPETVADSIRHGFLRARTI